MTVPGAARRLAAAAAFLGLAAAAIGWEVRDEHGRAALQVLSQRFGLDTRRPEYVATFPLAPAEDLAAGVLANAALLDAVEPVPLGGLAPALRNAWLRSAEGLDEELEAARVLMREALARRPGWAYHAFLLGTLTHVANGRRADRASDQEGWQVPLEVAAAGAPGDDAIWMFRAGAWLDGGAPSDGRKMAPVLRRAFLAPAFVTRALPRAAAVMGRPAALALVPDEVAPLRAAFGLLAGAGDLAGAAQAFARLEAAERKARVADLRRLEERARLGDLRGLSSEVSSFSAAHPVRERDDPEGRAQAARVLALWPADRRGDFWSDPRGDAIRFFLDGREGSVPGSVLAQASDALSNVPDPVKATVRLEAGDVTGATAIATGSPSLGSFDWTRFFVRLGARAERLGRLDEARQAVAAIAPAAREECDVLLLRRAIARAAHDDAEAGRTAERLGALLPREMPAAAWSASGSLSLCLDPEAAAARSLSVDISAAQPALVEYGWDGARSGTLLVSPGGRITVPLAGRAGRRAFHVRALAGGPVTTLRAAVE